MEKNTRYMIYVSDKGRGFFSKLFYDSDVSSKLESVLGPVQGLVLPSQYLLDEGKRYDNVQVFLASIQENSSDKEKSEGEMIRKLNEIFVDDEGRALKIFRLEDVFSSGLRMYKPVRKF